MRRPQPLIDLPPLSGGPPGYNTSRVKESVTVLGLGKVCRPSGNCSWWLESYAECGHFSACTFWGVPTEDGFVRDFRESDVLGCDRIGFGIVLNRHCELEAGYRRSPEKPGRAVLAYAR
jgi:hypothetical protein